MVVAGFDLGRDYLEFGAERSETQCAPVLIDGNRESNRALRTVPFV